MANPTRAEIEATIALPTYTISIDSGAGYVAIDDGEVASINTKLETTSNVDNAFAFGTVATTSATVSITDSTVITNWQEANIRIQYGFDASDQVVAFEGVIVKRQHGDHKYVYECQGYNYLIERKKIYTEVFYRRPIATKTTSGSIEDVSDPDYRGGLLNNIMWRVGGRPYEQPSYNTDPDFRFWYSFDESIVKPRWSWLSGENAWEEVFRLVRAAGGQFYQDKDGVLYYKQPLSFGYVDPLATLYAFTTDLFQSISEEASTIENLTTIQSSFVDRKLQPLQQVYETTTAQLLPDGESTEIEIEMQYPVYSYAANVNSFDFVTEAVKATFLDGRDATTDTVNFTVSIDDTTAQRLILTFNNNTGEPVSLNKMTVQGRPITAGSEGIAKYTNGAGTELQLEDNVYIQSFAQAYRLVRMVYDFYNTNRAIVTLDGVGYDPDRYLGEVVTLTYSDWSLSAAEHRIIALDYNNGAKMTVTLAPITGLVTRDDVFIVNNTYLDATTKLVSY